MSTRLRMLRCGGMRGFASVKPVQVATNVIVLATPYDPIDMIADWDSELVTFWKTILSLFLMCSANGFEGGGKRLVLMGG